MRVVVVDCVVEGRVVLEVEEILRLARRRRSSSLLPAEEQNAM